MTNFIDTINNDIKQAMRDKRSEDLSTLRMLLSALKNKKIDLGNKDELTDEQAMAVIKSEVKKRKDSIVSYQEGGRQDLVDKEQSEIDMLGKYLPEQMDEVGVEKIVAEIISAIPDANTTMFGRVMGEAIKKTGGQADGQMISSVVKRLLAK